MSGDGPGPPVAADVELDPSWAIGTKPHGGYLLSVVAAPAVDATHPHPLVVSAHYLTAPDTGTAQVEVERLRTGRRVATSRVRLSQGGRVCVEALVTAGTLSAVPPFWTGPARPPVLPPPQACLPAPAARPDGARNGHLDHVELLLDPATAGWSSGRVAGSGQVRGWLRRADGSATTPLDLLVYGDALPPVTFDLGLPGWVPTVELTVLLRGLPAPGWLSAVQRSSVLQDEWVDEDCEIWDSAGRLVAQGRQLAAYREPGR